MPEEIAELRDRYLTAIANSVAAQDAADAADAAEQDAREATGRAREAQSNALRIEREASDAYRAALRGHGYVDTASGPQPAPGIAFDARTSPDHAQPFPAIESPGFSARASGPQPAPGYQQPNSQVTQWGPTAELAPCGCPAQYLADHGSHQEGCESGERARSLGEQYRGRL
jgi:hypothetical protein